MSWTKKIYHLKPIAKLFHTTVYCLQKELADCDTVLDIGCGPLSPILYCDIKYSVGVEVFDKYLEEAKKNKTHSKYLHSNMFDLDYEENSFDAIVMVEVIEHLTYEDGLRLLELSEKWAKKKIILTTPNGYFRMDEAVDGNEFQRHLSGWSIGDLKALGFTCKGLAGLKCFYYSENNVHSLLDGNIYANYRFKPKILGYLINSICQIFSYHFPKYSFGILGTKNVD